MIKKQSIYLLIQVLSLFLGLTEGVQAAAQTPSVEETAAYKDIQRLEKAYPQFIQSVSDQYILWADGTKMPLYDQNTHKSPQEKLSSPALADQIIGVYYPKGQPIHPEQFVPTGDPGRTRYQPFFEKMYGRDEGAVKNKLTTVYWLPNLFGQRYPLLVTTVNGVDKKLLAISNELEIWALKHPQWITLLKPGGTYYWRKIANTDRLSLHSFGIAIDLNPNVSNYWQYDLKKSHQLISENATLHYRNDVPWDIVLIFERQGFIWGGKWYHYDTMHFEYRPELLIEL